MEFWSVLVPVLKITFYAASLGTTGTILFLLHFKHHLSSENFVYCSNLIKNSSLLGIGTSAASFFSIAGNMGGDLKSAFDIIMLGLAFETSSGFSALLALAGFTFILFWNEVKSFKQKIFAIFGMVAVYLSFSITGHSTLDGYLTQILVLIHLVGVSFWLGSFLPFINMCQSNKNNNLPVVAKLFGLFALVYVAAMTLAGIVFAYVLLGAFSPLIETAYGNTLLIKLVLVLSLMLLGAINKFKLVPMLHSSQSLATKKLQQSIKLEITLAILVLTVTSLLTTSINLPAKTLT